MQLQQTPDRIPDSPWRLPCIALCKLGEVGILSTVTSMLCLMGNSNQKCQN